MTSTSSPSTHPSTTPSTSPRPLKLQILSDLHLEKHPTSYQTYRIPPKAPYLILAGDIGRATTPSHLTAFLHFLSTQCSVFKKVFLVAGNNEFKGGHKPPNSDGHAAGLVNLRNMVREGCMRGRLVVLEDDVFDFTGEGYEVVMLGCTLWSRLLPTQGPGIGGSQDIVGWSNFKNNKCFDKSFKFIKDLSHHVRNDPQTANHRILVVTHHAPFIKGSSPPEYGEVPSNYSEFATDILGGVGLDGLREGDV
ncbi:hypothetical protein B0J14DRAFT_607659 [Halenospora varia]|nr:hypothetical protein B0J14DRAFT_607659 [Halenospora varia]